MQIGLTTSLGTPRALGGRLRRALWAADSQLGRWRDLIDQAEAALELEPHDEDAGRALMLAHWNNGDRGSALRAHDRLRSSLLSELGVEPTVETEDLYSAIVRDSRTETASNASTSGVISDDIRLAGRELEFQELLDAWERAVQGSVEFVVVSGPVGSGSTRLCDEIAELAERTGGRILKATSAEGERSLFLHPILEMVAQVALSTPPEELSAVLGPWLGTAAELIPELRRVGMVEEYQRRSADLEHRRALQTVEHVITRLAEKGPLLLVFDDLHHAGSSTIEALQWLLHQLPTMPLLIVAAVKPDHGDPGLAELAAGSVVVELGPISESGVSALAADAGLGDEAAFVWDLTQGHLLFVTEVLAALQRNVPRDSISGSLGSVVLDSVRRVGTDVQKVLQVASCVGLAFDLNTLSLVLDKPVQQLIPPLEAAVAASLVEPKDDYFAFSNPVIQEVLYESTMRPVRQEHHRTLAEVLAHAPEQRARHLEMAGQIDAAAESWMDAARIAQRAFSNRDAERLFSEALAAARRSGNTSVRGSALVGRGQALEELGQYELAANDHQAAVELAVGTGDRALRARAVERMGWTAYYRRDVAAAIARAEEATGMPGAHPSAWVLLGRIRHWGGHFEAASEAYNRALTELGEGDDEGVRASALSCLGALLAHSDRYPEAIDVLDEAVALCHEIGAFRPLLRALFFEGLARANSGDLAAALTALETKKTLLHRYDVPFYRARTNTCLAWIWRELGDLSRAQGLSEQALAESREVEEGELQVEQELHALCSLAECESMTGHADQAAAHLESAAKLLTGWLPFRWRAELRVTELSSRLGLESPERLLDDARNQGSSKYEALALHLLQRPEEAAAVASRTDSSLLLAEVATPLMAAVATEQLMLRLPRHLREGFATKGRLALLRPI